MYIITFFLTIVFTYFAEINFKKANKNAGILYSIIAIIVAAGLAGLRSKNIGTDVLVYVEPYFIKALQFKDFFEYIEAIDSDYLFLIIIYFIGNITQNLQWVLFTIELIIIVLIYWGIYNFREKASMSFMMFFFLTFFYNRTYNLSRQSLAVAVIFVGMKFVLERKFIKYSICVLIASMFHYSALFMIIIYFLYDIPYVKGNSLIKLVIISAIILSFYNFQNIFQLFITKGILPSKYMRYVEAQKGAFSVVETLYRLVNLLIIWMVSKKFYTLEKSNRFLFFILVLDIMIYQLGVLSDFTQRISFYFGINYIYVIPQIVNSVKQDKTNRTIAITLIALLQCLYWSVDYMYLNIGQTYPYKFFEI